MVRDLSVKGDIKTAGDIGLVVKKLGNPVEIQFGATEAHEVARIGGDPEIQDAGLDVDHTVVVEQ